MRVIVKAESDRIRRHSMASTLGDLLSLYSLIMLLIMAVKLMLNMMFHFVPLAA